MSEDVGKLELSYDVGRNIKCNNSCEWQFLNKLNAELQYDHAASFMGI